MSSPSKENKMAGVLGFYEDPDTLRSAMRKVRDANYQSFDAFTPFPVHGLEHDQGLKRSKLPYITFVAGLTGVTLGFLLQWWTSVVDWPVIIAGKPMNSWPAFVPVMFECTILFGGIATVFGMFALNRLPNVTKKAFDPSITRDRFAIIIEAPDALEDEEVENAAHYKKFDAEEASQFLKSTGALEVRKVFEEGWF